MEWVQQAVDHPIRTMDRVPRDILPYAPATPRRHRRCIPIVPIAAAALVIFYVRRAHFFLEVTHEIRWRYLVWQEVVMRGIVCWAGNAAVLPLVFVLSFMPTSCAQTAGGSEAVPKSLDQGKVDRPLREKYKSEFASRDPAVRGTLAHTLREGADKEADYTTKFVMLREARELAVGAGDMPYTLDIIDDMAATFAINPAEMKANALAAAVDQARIPPIELGQSYLKVADDALAVWNLDLAEKAAYLVQKVGRGDGDLVAAGKERDKISRVRTHLLLQVIDAEKKLVRTPDDPQLNQTVGIHFCFNLNKWETGLSYLAKSASPSLKAIADKDQAAPADPSAMAALADAWWDFADPKSGLPVACGHRRAAYWYGKALPGLNGDKKAEAEKRSADVNGELNKR